MIGRCRRRRELSVCEEEDHWTFDLLTLHMRRTVPHLTTEGTVSPRGVGGLVGGAGGGGLPLNWSHFKVLSFNIVLNKLTKMIKADFRDEGFSIRGESPREHQTDSKVSPEQRGIVFNLRNIDTFTE